MTIKDLKDCKILVTPTSFAKYNKDLAKDLEKMVGEVVYNTTGKPLKEADLLPIIEKFDGMIAGLDEITGKVIENAKNLKVIARYGAGVDRVDLEAAKKAGIYVTNTPGVNSVSVAELTIGLAIAAARNIIIADTQTKTGSWPRLSGISLCDKTFGIIGFGNIGKELAKRLSLFEMKILAYDIYFDKEFASKYNIEYAEIDDLFKNSDFISLHIPVTAKTSNIINKENIEKMKDGVILINTSRGELIDEDALYESLVNGKVRAVALDTFKKEPPDSDNKLLSLKQVIATPHMGAATDNASNEMTRISISDCLAVLKGEKPKFAVIEP
ncbi:MAG: phosphoglycerate dehydrogenase [Actinobacteria bacterium]|nr:phosphoglycerate dehydrogenase [Cyanobacteriota bacterium]MCL5770815.1 phosphoglycerate dehydrogenase [Actinomycetota bacterium]